MALISRFFVCGVLVSVFGFLVLISGARAATPLDLPDLDAMVDYRPKIPLRVFTSDGALIGEFGQERREFVAIKDIPLIQRQALLAIEDSRFYDHGGVDFRGVARAVLADLKGGLKQGASTITMQVARDFYLTKEKLFSRKITEVMLAYKMERTLTKDQILELYMNQVYLGQRAYGFSSAARIYFGKPLKELSIAQAAMLAGLPQAPSVINPIANPKRAKARQQLVLTRMRDLAYITEAQYKKAWSDDLRVIPAGQSYNNRAQYAAEMVRESVYAQFKEETYTRGIVVTTTLVQAEQDAAYAAVRKNVLAYDQRRGYRGPEGFVALPRDAAQRDKLIEATLEKYSDSDNLLAAVVRSVSPTRVQVVRPNGAVLDITGDGLRWAAAGLSSKAKVALRIKVGSVIRVMAMGKGRWQISQLPNVGAAFVALNNQTGAYRALVGGFDFGASPFNHVTQAWRQPGSAMKPFIYSAALDKGFSPATMVNDAPLTLTSAETGGQPWTPQNDDGVYDGAISLRTAFAKSKNVVAVRILRAITPQYAHDFLPRFGFDMGKQPVNYTLVLGSGAVTPVQLAGAYSVFANGGFAVTPYLIQKVVDIRGTVLFEAKPVAVAQESARVLDARNAFITTNLLREVTVSGTAASTTPRLGRTDLAGKTGTSSDAIDGWFAGFSGATTAVAWMGFDEPRSLGAREFGSTVALPIWIDYMRVALHGKPVNAVAPPPGVSYVAGDWLYDAFKETGGVTSLDLDLLERIKGWMGP